MLAGDIEIVDQELTSLEVDDVVNCLAGNTVRILCLRGCTMSDDGFERMMSAVGTCQSLLQINCALGVVNTPTRIHFLSQALGGNHSLRDVFLHSNPLGDEGTELVCGALFNHPKVISLDLGECGVGDLGLDAVCRLLPANGPKLGLQDLVLSSNANITSMGWAKFAVALSSCSTLRALHVDYNTLGDYCVGCIVMSLASNKHMEHLDLEATQLTQHSADLLLHLMRNYPVPLKKLILLGNDVHPSTLESIRLSLDDLRDGEIDMVKLATCKEKSRKSEKDAENRKNLANKSDAIMELSKLMAEDTDSELLNFANDPNSAESAQEDAIVESRKEIKTQLFAESEINEKGDSKVKKKPPKGKSRAKKDVKNKKSCDKMVNQKGDNDGDVSSTEEYEEMKEIPIHEIQQPNVQTWVSVTKPI